MLSIATEPPTESCVQSSNSLPWRVLRVESGREFDIQRHMESRSIEAYLPTYSAMRRFTDRRPVPVTRVLFGGYIFCAIEDVDFQLALQVPRVIGMLRFGGKPAEIELAEMERIRAMASMPQTAPWDGLVTGDRVRLAAGPLRGTYGRVLSRKGQLQVIVEVELLSRWIKITVEGHQIERA